MPMKSVPLIFAVMIAPFWATAEDAKPAEQPKPYTQKLDTVFGETDGVGLLMDVFTPKAKPNGLAIVDVASGEWHSDRGKIRDHERAQFYDIFCSRGYVVFAIRPGSKSKFNGLEMLANVKTGIRFVRAHAKEYNIDPERLGLTGASAGGHLACLAAVTADAGNPDAKDEGHRSSSHVKAVAVFFPPTDFLDWNGSPVPADKFQDLFFGDRASHTRVEAEARAEELSPAVRVKNMPPPFLLIHGDADNRVPLQQSQIMLEALQKAGGSAELIVKPGGGHPWPTISEEVKIFADWFDKQLKS
ncbi:MAG: alpha/beta fold hydrolase [Candidatus Hydrogenedentes bacterium]|nr:alpha/beta fold hydrolase [Candidatus Hydrogenedentota bacterium]